MVVYNEADRIADTLTRAAVFCDELVVVDQASTDNTRDLARDFGATVIADKHYGFCEPSRELAAQYTMSSHILVLDADERIDTTHVAWLLNLPAKCEGAWLARDNYIGGELLPIRPDRQFRWFKKGTATYLPRLHRWILPKDPDRVLNDGPWGVIVHEKSLAEHDADFRRYELLRQR